MTIEDLIGKTADELAAMSDSQLMAIATENGWLKITRPELAEKPVEKSSVRTIGETLSDEKRKKLQRARLLADQFGFDLE